MALLLLCACPVSLAQGPAQPAPPSEPPLPLKLTPEESAWLTRHPRLRVAGWDGTAPFLFSGVDGWAQGVITDYVRLVGQRLGVSMEIGLEPDFKTAWRKTLEGKYDIVPGVTFRPERGQFMTFTKPYLVLPVVLVTRENHPLISGLNDLAGATVVVTEGLLPQTVIAKDYPSVNLRAVDKVALGLREVSEGRAQAMAEALPGVVHHSQKACVANLKVAATTEYSYTLSMAVGRDQALLAGLLERALASIGDAERQMIYERWVPIKFQPGVELGLFWKVLIIVCLSAAMVLAGVVWRNRRLTREVTARRRMEEELRRAKERFEKVFHAQLDALLILDAQVPPVILDCNEAAERTFGYKRREMLGRPTSLIHADEERARAFRERLYPAVERDGYYVDPAFFMRRKDGQVFPVELSTAQLLDHDGRRVGWVSIIRDNSERLRAQQERERLFNLSLDLMCVASFDGYLKELNPAWSQLLGWSLEELKSRPYLEFVHPEDMEATLEAGRRLKQGHTVLGFENRYRCRDGSYLWISWNSQPLPEEGLIYAVAHDVSERKRMEDDLKRLATTDSLTGVSSRHQFLEAARQEFGRAQRYGGPLAMLMLDLDHFMRVNDTHGHAVGDVVLRSLVRTCRATLRESDLMGRLGGEEFAALLVEAGPEQALSVAERVRSAIEATPASADGLTIAYTASLGVAVLRPEDLSLEDLLKRADQAMYQAKERGRNRVVMA